MKEWILTEEAFNKLLTQLDTDRERAGEKYEWMRLKLMKFFEWRGCLPPEEYTDKVIDRVAKKIAEGEDIRASDPYVYFHGVARFVVMERWREPEREQESLDEMPPSLSPSENPEELKERELAKAQLEKRLDCMNHCLDKLPPESRDMILQYHQGEGGAKIKNRKEMAARLQMPLNALRIRAHRIRDRLEACVEDCASKSLAT
jgi:DNA-directed RNA polymerase specialized sigma24 family protein